MTSPPTGQPDDAYFDVMARYARSHWWYRNRRAWVRQLLADRPCSGRALDVGCGTGEMVNVLESVGFDRPVGSDLSPYVLGYAHRRSGQPLVRALAEGLPVRGGVAACITSLDVIEHLDDDVRGLRECARVAAPGATVVLMVPAYAWLWSDHDDNAGHRRRYTARRLRAAAEAAQIDVAWVGYHNSFLTPVAALSRRTPLRRFTSGAEEDLSGGSRLVNGVCWALASVERWIGRRVTIPFGLTVCLIGTTRAPADGHRAVA